MRDVERHRNNAVETLVAAIKQDQTGDLTRLAAQILVDEAMDDGSALVLNIIKDDVCPFCGSLHRSKLHDEYHRMSLTEEWYNLIRELNFNYNHTIVFERMPGADLSLLRDPQEY